MKTSQQISQDLSTPRILDQLRLDGLSLSNIKEWRAHPCVIDVLHYEALGRLAVFYDRNAADTFEFLGIPLVPDDTQSWQADVVSFVFAAIKKFKIPPPQVEAPMGGQVP